MSFFLFLLLAQPDAASLLKQVDENYSNLKVFHIESDSYSSSQTDNSSFWSRSRSTLILESPTRLRYDSSEPNGSYQVVSDGKTLWRAAKHLRQFIASPIIGPVFDVKDGGNEGMSAIQRMRFTMPGSRKRAARLLKAEYLEDETLLDSGTPVRCKVVDAEYQPVELQTQIHRKYWIDPERLIILKESGYSIGAPNFMRPYENFRSESSATYRHVHLGKLPANQNFQFDPPSNFGEVDKMEAGMNRARTIDMIGKPAPNFKADTLDGVSTSLSDFKGKLVLLDFWATWCAPCRDQMPKIAKLYDQTRDQGLVLLGINDDESIEKPIEYMKQHAYQWLNLFESKPGSIRRNFAVDGIPTLILIDREGKVIEYQVGSGTESEEKIRAALRKQGLKLD